MHYTANNFIISRVIIKFLHLLYVQVYFKSSIWTIRLNVIQKPLEFGWIFRVYFFPNYLKFYKKDSLSVDKLTTWKIAYIFTFEVQALWKVTPLLLEREVNTSEM